MAVLICEYCHEVFEAPRKGAQTLRFCSRNCRSWRVGGLEEGPWTVNHEALMLAVATTTTDIEAAALFGRNKALMRAVRRKFGLLRRFEYTPEDDAVIVDLYPHVPTLDLALLLGKSEAAVAHRAARLGVRKSAERLIEASRAHFLLPKEVREVMALNNKLKKELRDAEHRRSARQSVRRTGSPERSSNGG